jgi:2-hydroxychromene-2-carboxylate isomerase
MVRDMERLAAERNLDFALPKPFPANSLYAARLALVGKRRGWIAPFTKAVFKAAFGRGEDIACAMVLENAVSSLGIDVESANAMATAPETKEALREETASAQRRGIFGAPTFIAEDGELFWGDDRLEQAFAWLRQT